MSAVSSPTGQSPGGRFIPAFLRDVRVLQIIGQIVFAILLLLIASSIWNSILGTLQSRNLTPSTNFLANRAGFDISEGSDWYSSNSTYGDAFRVGVENSLRIIGVGLVLTTILGILAGIFLLSSNWLIRTITRAIVELLRNTPLLVQLIGWYFIVILSLPLFQEPFTLPQEGIQQVTLRLVLYLVALVLAWFALRRYPPASPRRIVVWTGLAAAILALEVGFRLNLTNPSLYGSGRLDNLWFWGYVVVSVAAVLAARYLAPLALRWRLLGLSVGQLLGGLLFYFGILPNSIIARVEVYPALIISRRGVVLPEILPTARFTEWIIFVVIGLVLAGAIWVYFGRITETTGEPTRRLPYAIISIVAFIVIGWAVASIAPQPSSIPVPQEDGTVAFMTVPDAEASGLLTRADEQAYSQSPLLYIPPVQRISPAGIVSGLESGMEITPAYTALLVGLVIYTAAFVAEIVRAGILAVPPGQLEAARALGLSTSQTLTIVILPQALRVIIPPLGNQYLNLSKNSSLAVAVAYADIVLVTQTIMNQSGQSVTGIVMIMLTYLAISLLIAAFTNIVNRRFQLVTR